jgi:glycosyltransferase involved in cell wall biosynthesis
VTGVRTRAGAPPRVAPPDAPQRVGFVGRLERVKGCEYFIDAAGLITASHPDVAFVIAGTGSLDATLRARAASSPASKRITFSGYLDEPAPLLSTLDVLCVPSLSEASGLSAMESLALGVPVVAWRGVTGALVPPADSGALAAAVSGLLADPERARALGRAGREHVEQHFTAARMVAAYLRVYEDLAACQPA